ncbi:MAG: 2-isopropylmalate synthase, partial [Synechococcus sp. SB0664_bin_36]|nr:2-isopropylmalate synthase [Synechococcus sp. SB0664_bin_36]
DQAQQVDATYKLKLVQVSCGTNLRPTATVTLEDSQGGQATTAAIGTGPVDAVCRAIDELVKVPNELVEFSIQAVTEGIDALGVVTIRVRQGDILCSGYSADTDVVVASAQAFVAAMNRLLALSQNPSIHPQHTEVSEAQPDKAMAASP